MRAELAEFKNIILLPIKGYISLASKLAGGGDYDFSRFHSRPLIILYQMLMGVCHVSSSEYSESSHVSDQIRRLFTSMKRLYSLLPGHLSICSRPTSVIILSERWIYFTTVSPKSKTPFRNLLVLRGSRRYYPIYWLDCATRGWVCTRCSTTLRFISLAMIIQQLSALRTCRNPAKLEYDT